MREFISRDYVGLPKRYWKYQTFCWYIHDIILSLFHDCMVDNKMGVSIKFENLSDAKKFETSEDVIQWMYDNGYSTQATKVLGQRIFHAILADMLNFLYESLNTIEKGKITVSLALLRKPIRENLLYLEWLLAFPDEFIQLVRNADINKYAIENVSAEKKMNIIRESIKQIDNKPFFEKMNANLYYDLRYNKDAGNSLQMVWDKANHLVTTRKQIRSREFNFIFIDKEIHEDFIDYYYKQIPHLLFYTYNVVLKLYERFIRKIRKSTKSYNNYLITFKFLDLTGKVKDSEFFDKELEVLLSFICLNCMKVIKVKKRSKQFRGYRYGWGFDCPECNNEIVISRYFFLEDYKKMSKAAD